MSLLSFNNFQYLEDMSEKSKTKSKLSSILWSFIFRGEKHNSICYILFSCLPKTNKIQANIQISIAVNPSAFGEFVVMLLKILIRTRNSVIRRAIRPKDSGNIIKYSFNKINGFIPIKYYLFEMIRDTQINETSVCKYINNNNIIY